jgi:hypothetical protein|nr:MAG TPA: hypothetical protein [Caudoviricetes sp.]
MSKSRIVIKMDANDIMDCLSESEAVGFAYDCYDYLGIYQRRDLIEMLGVEEIVGHLDEDIVEYLDDKAMIEELKGRGYLMKMAIMLCMRRLFLLTDIQLSSHCATLAIVNLTR